MRGPKLTEKTPADVRRYMIPQNTLYLGPVPTPKEMRKNDGKGPRKVVVRTSSQASRTPRATE